MSFIEDRIFLSSQMMIKASRYRPTSGGNKMLRNLFCSTALLSVSFFLNFTQAIATVPAAPAPTAPKPAPFALETPCAVEAPCVLEAPQPPCVVEAPCAVEPPCAPKPPPMPEFSPLQTPKLSISGATSFNSWFFNNNKKLKNNNEKNSPCNLQKYGRGQLFTVDDGRLRFAVDGKLDTGMEYGLVFVLDGATNKVNTLRENYLFFGGTWGKIFAGDTYGVPSTMSFGGFSEWGGTGFLNSGGNMDRVVNFTTGTLVTDLITGDTSRDTKLTYLTPRWNGIQIGISYTPRSEHRGEQEINSVTSTSSPKEPFDTDNIANGINFIHKFANGFEMALSATSAFAGKTHPEFRGGVPRERTASFAFGGDFSYNNIGFGLEYGNNLRSRQIKNHKTNAGQFIDFGLSYTWGATKFSTGYYYGWRKALLTSNTSKKAITNAVSAAVDQKLAPGLGVYIEYAHFSMKNSAALAEAARTNKINTCDFTGGVKSNKANVFVVGSRLVF